MRANVHTHLRTDGESLMGCSSVSVFVFEGSLTDNLRPLWTRWSPYFCRLCKSQLPAVHGNVTLKIGSPMEAWRGKKKVSSAWQITSARKQDYRCNIKKEWSRDCMTQIYIQQCHLRSESAGKKFEHKSTILCMLYSAFLHYLIFSSFCGQRRKIESELRVQMFRLRKRTSIAFYLIHIW